MRLTEISSEKKATLHNSIVPLVSSGRISLGLCSWRISRPDKRSQSMLDICDLPDRDRDGIELRATRKRH